MPLDRHLGHCRMLARVMGAGQAMTCMMHCQVRQAKLHSRTDARADSFRTMSSADWYLGNPQVARCTLHQLAEGADRLREHRTGLLRQLACSLGLLLVRPSHLEGTAVPCLSNNALDVMTRKGTMSKAANRTVTNPASIGRPRLQPKIPGRSQPA